MSDSRTPFQTSTEIPDTGAELIEDSPLREVDTAAIDELLERINEDLLAGAPQRITDDDQRLKDIVVIYRQQAENWVIIESEKKPRAKSPARPRTAGVVLDLDI